jgi:hypothetical protein
MIDLSEGFRTQIRRNVIRACQWLTHARQELRGHVYGAGAVGLHQFDSAHSREPDCQVPRPIRLTIPIPSESRHFMRPPC